MAISYGTASTGGGAQNFRVGYEFSGWTPSSPTSGTTTVTGTIQFYVRNAAAVTSDTEDFAYTSGTATMSGVTSNSIVNTQTVATDRTIGPARDVSYTYSTWGSSPGNFTGSITGSAFYVGSNCTHSWSIAIPARPGAIPSAPTSVTSTPQDGYISISFGAPSTNDPATTAYQYSGDDGVSGWNNITTNPFNVTGANGTAITVYVKAINAVGSGPSASTTSTPRTLPGAPASVTSTPGNGSVSIGFTAPSSDGGSAVTSYQSSTDNATWSTIATNPFTVAGTNGTAVTVYVRAVNVVGAGAQNNATSTPRTVPSAPQSFAGSNTTFGQLSLSWAAPSSNGGNAVSSYVLRTGSTVLQNTSATSYVHTGLSPYTDYSYTVTAANAAGEGTAASLTVKTMGGVAKVWNGTAWVTILPKVWNGTAWVEAQARMWNGTSWVHGI